MPTYHGSTVDVRLSRILAEGKIIQEYIGTLNGAAANQTFYTRHFPITTNAGVATDDETLVDVYTDDKTLGDWTEYLDDGSDFVIIGATGAVTIQAAENAGGNATERIAISYYTDETLARGQGASWDFLRDKEIVHALGSPAPQEIKTGHWTVSGTIDTLLSTDDNLSLALNESDFYKVPADVSLYIYPNKNAASQPYIKITNCVFTGVSVKAPLKGLVTVGLKFDGLLAALGNNP